MTECYPSLKACVVIHLLRHALMPDSTFRGLLTSIESVPDYSVSFKLYPYINQYHSILYSLFNVSGIGYLKDRNMQAVEKKSRKNK